MAKVCPEPKLRRALASLDAELKRRERVLRELVCTIRVHYAG